LFGFADGVLQVVQQAVAHGGAGGLGVGDVVGHSMMLASGSPEKKSV
jgi:hypothetical protein